jgi:hypothetical protein
MAVTRRMIVVGTLIALSVGVAMSTSSYGAESSQEQYVERLSRIFVGVPKQLSVPPGFPIPVGTDKDADRAQTTDTYAPNAADSKTDHHVKDQNIGIAGGVDLDYSLRPIIERFARSGERN